MKSKKIFSDVKKSEQNFMPGLAITHLSQCKTRPNNIDSDSKGVLYNTKFKSRQVCGVSVRFGRERWAGELGKWAVWDIN